MRELLQLPPIPASLSPSPPSPPRSAPSQEDIERRLMEQMNEKFQITEQQLKQGLARKVHVCGNDCVEKAAGKGDGVWCL